MSTAATYHATAVALSMMRATPLALKNEQRCYEIVKELYGESDPRTLDSAHWLQRFSATNNPAAPAPNSNTMIVVVMSLDIHESCLLS